MTWGALASAIVGLGASISSAVDWFAPAPAFCADVGCANVKSSAFSSVLGIPTPVLGIAFFAAAALLTFQGSTISKRARKPVAVAGGLVGVSLILVQAFVVHAWCKLCLVADLAGIAHAAAVLGGARSIRTSAARALLATPAVGAVVGALALWTRAPEEPPIPAGVPDVVERAQVTPLSEEGLAELTVVEFVDFECPFCREMQARLTAAMEQVPHRVRVVRKMTPLPQHEGAMPAALAWCCAEQQGRGDEMADALFSAPPEDLTPEGCARMAECIGLDMEQYRRSLSDPATHERVAADMTDARAAGVHRLPTIFVGTERVTGASRSTTELVSLLDRAAASRASAQSPSASTAASAATAR